jgi:hypothetical protein
MYFDIFWHVLMCFDLFLLTAKPIRAGHHPSGIPAGPVGIRGGSGARPMVTKALTEADLLRRPQN